MGYILTGNISHILVCTILFYSFTSNICRSISGIILEFKYVLYLFWREGFKQCCLSLATITGTFKIIFRSSVCIHKAKRLKQWICLEYTKMCLYARHFIVHIFVGEKFTHPRKLQAVFFSYSAGNLCHM